jgi:MinD superfamily P-loop ATPase
MKQLAVISGKGGTGKSSLVAAIAALARPIVTADCDVDAADLHLIFSPGTGRVGQLEGGATASIDASACVACGRCADLCRFDAVGAGHVIDPFACEGCGVCADHCPAGAITLQPEVAGEWYVSRTRFGPLAHARLGVAQESSGRLVTRVREEAAAVAEREGAELVLIDGPPGIGCPVIATITGVDLVLIVTEPTVSGYADMARVLDLAAHFRVPAAVTVNKADVYPAMRDHIHALSRARGASLVGDVPYDPGFTAAMVAGLALPELSPTGGPALAAVGDLWASVWDHLQDVEHLDPPCLERTGSANLGGAST